MSSGPKGADERRSPTHRLARITVDVLLPAHYSTTDLSEFTVDSVRVGVDRDFEDLNDVVHAQVVEARVVIADA